MRRPSGGGSVWVPVRSALWASLNIRTGQAKSGHADLGHQQMVDEMQECIGRIENMDNKPKQAQKRQKTETKGVGASINAFALLGEDEEEEEEVCDRISLNNFQPSAEQWLGLSF